MPLIMLTNKALERDLLAAVAAVQELDAIEGELIRLRVETLDR